MFTATYTFEFYIIRKAFLSFLKEWYPDRSIEIVPAKNNARPFKVKIKGDDKEDFKIIQKLFNKMVDVYLDKVV